MAKSGDSREGGGGYSFVVYLSHLTIDHASPSRRCWGEGMLLIEQVKINSENKMSVFEKNMVCFSFRPSSGEGVGRLHGSPKTTRPLYLRVEARNLQICYAAATNEKKNTAQKTKRQQNSMLRARRLCFCSSSSSSSSKRGCNLRAWVKG